MNALGKYVRMVGLLSMVVLSACARLPYTTAVVIDTPRVQVVRQQELDAAAYTHPVLLTTEDTAAILRALSYRPKTMLPLRWYEEEAPPKPVFRADEVQVLSGPLAQGLRQAGPHERVVFHLVAAGLNPALGRDVTAGWIAVREPFLYVALEYVHVQWPVRASDPYDTSYPTPPTTPRDYLLYFEPGRFWTVDPVTKREAIVFRSFLKSVIPNPATSVP